MDIANAGYSCDYTDFCMGQTLIITLGATGHALSCMFDLDLIFKTHLRRSMRSVFKEEMQGTSACQTGVAILECLKYACMSLASEFFFCSMTTSR